MFPVLHRIEIYYHCTTFYLEMLIAVQQGYMVDLNLHLLLNFTNLISLELILAYLLTRKCALEYTIAFFKNPISF